LKRQTLFLHSGTEARFATGFQDFRDSWRPSSNWALTITTPGDLPATINQKAGTEAASGLEKAGQTKAAAAAYGALLERWPDNLPALMGFGNARYAAGDIKAASTAFRHAVTLYPTAAEAWNNLAVTLSDQGLRDEALAAAKRAVKLGGPHQAAARKTLADLAEGTS
jgi:tetratricopeptide (TPR) repeat protein